MSITSKKDFWISTFLPFSAAMAASGTLIPLFIISTMINGTVSDIGIISAISSLISLPLAFIWGKLTDDTGKRKIFILIMFISGFGILLGYFFALDIYWVIVLSIMSGLMLGAGDTAKNMYIFDKYPPEEWEEVISKYQQRTGIGACLGLVFGGLFQLFFINQYGYFFLICAILAGVSAVLAYFFIKDVSTDKIKEYKVAKAPIMNMDLPMYSSLIVPQKIVSYKIEAADQKGPTKNQLTYSLLMFFLGGFALFLASNLTFTPLAAYMKQNLGIQEGFIFWIFLGYYAISVVGYTFAGNWIDKQGNQKILFTGLSIRIGVYTLFAIFTLFTLAFTESFIVIIVLLILAGLSYALMNVALQNILPRMIKRNIGEILALYSIIVGSSAIVGSYFSGIIAESALGYLGLFLLSVAFAAVAGAIYYVSLRKVESI